MTTLRVIAHRLGCAIDKIVVACARGTRKHTRLRWLRRGL